MATTATPAATDRSDFRTVTTGGAVLGAATGVAVVLVVALSRLLTGTSRDALAALVVLAQATLAAFLPARWTRARTVDGIAGTAAMGLVGTVAFSAIDIVALRPLKAYPWTWDAIGGGSTWWYLPVWWMLGTFLAWMGGIVAAGAAAGGGDPTLARAARPAVLATVIVAAVTRLAGLPVALPVITGAAFTIVLVAFALVALRRKA